MITQLFSVTVFLQGARRKLAASVTRLRERPHILAGLDREVEEGRADGKKILTDLEVNSSWEFVSGVIILFQFSGSSEMSYYNRRTG